MKGGEVKVGVKADLSRNLRVLLAEKMISQTELHAKTGISRNTISAICRGHSDGIQFDTLDKLCEALEIKPSDLLKTKKD